MKKLKICFPVSSGGHLTQIYALKQWWNLFDRFWVTFNKADAKSLLKNEKTIFCFYPTNRHVINLMKNTILAFSVLWKERPDVIVSTGAAIAIPFFYIGKLFGCKLIYIEVYDRIDSPTLTGKIVYPVTDKFLVQWEEQKKYYPKGELWGQAI